MSAPVAGATAPEPAPGPDPEGRQVAARLKAFVAEHGGTGTAVVSYLGRGGARIVVVSADGPFADAVVPTDQAEAVCAAAGIPTGTWDRELSGRVTASAADRRRMAGTGR